MRIRLVLLTALLTTAVAAPVGAQSASHAYGDIVEYRMLFPVAQGADYTYYWDTFWAARSNGDHHAQDIMAPKMTPIVAPTYGTIGMVNWSRSQDDFPNPDRCCTLTLDHDDGWTTWYIHLNNDTPGTDDGQAWGIAPGIKPGTRVVPGQLLGWVGDSGNAENTGPHLHFELRDPEGTIVNPIEALEDATRVNLGLRCEGRPVTVFGTRYDDVLVGTPGDDVIHGRGGDDVIDGEGGDDVICGGGGDDVLRGGPGDDHLRGNTGNDRLLGGSGADVLRGAKGRDLLRGQDGPDRLYGNRAGDRLHGGADADVLYGGGGGDRLNPGTGTDQSYGGGGRDRMRWSTGDDLLDGGNGTDVADYRSAGSAAVDLASGTVAGPGNHTLVAIEDVWGSAGADLIIGDENINLLRGGSGDDVISGGGGDDRLVGGEGNDDLDGGDGQDWCGGAGTGYLNACEDGPI